MRTPFESSYSVRKAELLATRVKASADLARRYFNEEQTIETKYRDDLARLKNGHERKTRAEKQPEEERIDRDCSTGVRPESRKTPRRDRLLARRAQAEAARASCKRSPAVICDHVLCELCFAALGNYERLPAGTTLHRFQPVFRCCRCGRANEWLIYYFGSGERFACGIAKHAEGFPL